MTFVVFSFRGRGQLQDAVGESDDLVARHEESGCVIDLRAHDVGRGGALGHQGAVYLDEVAEPVWRLDDQAGMATVRFPAHDCPGPTLRIQRRSIPAGAARYL